jgi:adenylylsulfate kinase
LPGSGKSVISEALARLLGEKGIHVQLLSSDALRKVLTPKPSYSLDERGMVYATLVYIAGLLTHNGVNVAIDATGNLRCYRDHARKTIPKFIEAYLECPLGFIPNRSIRCKSTEKANWNDVFVGDSEHDRGIDRSASGGNSMTNQKE